MSTGPNSKQINPTVAKEDIKWLDFQIDKKKQWASYSHFVRYAIHHFRYVEPRRLKKMVK